jgi:hypothetical protein
VKLLPSPTSLEEGDFERLASSFTRRGLVKNAEDWKWSSMREFAGVSGDDQQRFCGLRIERVPLPCDVHTRI